MLVLAVEVVMEELGKTWDDVIVGLTMGGDTAGGDILEELTVGEGILEILTECTMAVVESGARSESSSAWVDTTLSSKSESEQGPVQQSPANP